MKSGATHSLETEPVGRLLLKYAMPAIAGMIVFSLYNVVDSIFIGRWVGEYALAGLAVSFPVMNLSVALGTLFGIGGAALCSIRLGEKNHAGAEEAFGNVFSLGIIFGGIFAIVSTVFLEPVLVAFGASAQTLPFAYRFMLIVQLSVPVTYTFFNLTHMMRATGSPNRALAALSISVGVNILLAPLFIKIFAWGITGAALATFCAQLCGIAFVLHHFFSGKSIVKFRRGIFRPRARTVIPMFSIGCAPSILNICACAIAVIFNRQLLAHGGDLAVGAYGIFCRVVILGAMTVIGLTQGMQPIVGYNHGACRYDRVRRAFFLTMIAGTALTTLCFAVCEIAPRAIARAFTDNAELVEYTVRGLRIGTAAFALVGAQIVINNFFQAIGRGKTSAFLSTTRQLLFLVPGLFVFPHFWGQDGIWLSLPVADLASVVVTALVFFHFLRNYTPKKAIVDPGFQSCSEEKPTEKSSPGAPEFSEKTRVLPETFGEK